MPVVSKAQKRRGPWKPKLSLWLAAALVPLAAVALLFGWTAFHPIVVVSEGWSLHVGVETKDSPVPIAALQADGYHYGEIAPIELRAWGWRHQGWCYYVCYIGKTPTID